MINLVAKLRRSLPMYPAGSEIKQLLTAAADRIEHLEGEAKEFRQMLDQLGD